MRTASDLVSAFATQAGNQDRPAVTVGWIRPARVEVSGENLVFDYDPPLQQIRSTRGMMQGLLRLADAPDDRIRAYAAKWGALFISPVNSVSGEVVKPPDGNFWEKFFHGPEESLREWRAFVVKVRKLLLAAADIDREVGRAVGNSVHEERRIAEMGLNVQRQVNQMLFSSVRPLIIWNRRGWDIRLRADNLHDAVAIQVMLMIARSEGVALCGSCGVLFETDGKRKVYCSGCGRAAAQRAASKKLYNKKRIIRHRLSRGESAEDIAEDLGERISKIHRWLRTSDKRRQ